MDIYVKKVTLSLEQAVGANPHLLDGLLTDDGKVSLTRRPPFTFQEDGRFLVLISVRG
jgi:hypothetical protein